MKQTKKSIFTIKFKLLLMILLPSILLGSVLSAMVIQNMQAGMQETTFNGLRGIATSLQQVYNSLDSGEYVVDESGIVSKGGLTISNSYEIIDNFKNSTNYDVTIFYGDTRVTTSLTNSETNERLVGTKASDVVIDAVLNNGKEYSDANVVINGEPYYGYYVPIMQNNKAVGMTFAGTPSATMDEFIMNKVIGIIIASTVILIITIVAALLFAARISKAIKNTESAISELGKGNLNITIDKHSKTRGDEIGSMSRELENVIAKLISVISDVKNSSKILYESGSSLEQMASRSNITTGEINNAIEDVSKGVANQASETEAATCSITDMGNIITDIVSSVDALGKSAADMKRASDESTIIINELSLSNDRTTDAIEKISKQIYATNESVQDIRQAVELITAIADQTNLLSLNASIEAARAGEQGRGFAVVASEIQSLADDSNNSASEIQKIINDLLQESENTVKIMDEVNAIVNEQREKLTETKSKFEVVADGVEATRKEAQTIQHQTAACDQNRAHIMEVIQNLSAISEENAASSQETAASMEDLNSMLQKLNNSSNELMQLSNNLENDMSFFKM